jgi:hypothetical protein
MKRSGAVIGMFLALLFLSGCAATGPVTDEKPDIPLARPAEPPVPDAAPPVKPPPTRVVPPPTRIVPPVEPPVARAVPPVAPPATDTAPLLFPDRDLLLQGIALLGRAERPDPPEARKVFALLVENHPGSRWRPAAEALIRLIDAEESARENARQERHLKEKALAERSRALQEIEQLKRTVRELTERLQAETAVLAQENEQLKNDIQRLKALEIELQKRERILR